LEEIVVANAKRDEKVIRKDQTGPREVREDATEELEEINSGTSQPKIENPNRDRTRGDWDRTGDHHDENP
jgi:uncharacterized protein (UPF0147 family)